MWITGGGDRRNQNRGPITAIAVIDRLPRVVHPGSKIIVERENSFGQSSWTCPTVVQVQLSARSQDGLG